MAENPSAAVPPRPQSPDGGPAAAAFVGRTPPHSLEAEEYLLSCCLIDGGDTIARCLEFRLTPEATNT